LIVLNLETGKVITTLPIGEGVDGVVFNSTEKLIFTSNGDSGTITIIKQESQDTYSVLENASTAKGAKTLALDQKKNTIYVSSAEFTAPTDGSKPTIVPNTFGIIVIVK
jgi:DNA-binding beta-propeller fold protein YncE